MEYTVAKSTETDFENLQKLFIDMFKLFPENQNINYPETKEGIDYLKGRIKNGIAFTLKHNDNAIGFIFGSIQRSIAFKTYSKYGFIENMYIDDKYRNIGLGKLLLDKFKEKCKAMQISIIQTDSEFAQNSVNFYTKNGFKISGISYIMKLEKDKSDT